jgi:hypothetical protein
MENLKLENFKEDGNIALKNEVLKVKNRDRMNLFLSIKKPLIKGLFVVSTGLEPVSKV